MKPLDIFLQVWDQAVLRLDLIDAPIDLTAGRGDGLTPWNKNSLEPSSLSADQYKAWFKKNNGTDNDIKPGFISFLTNVSSDKSERYIPGHYKYIVVVGYELSTTGRMAQLLAHSGANRCYQTFFNPPYQNCIDTCLSTVSTSLADTR